MKMIYESSRIEANSERIDPLSISILFMLSIARVSMPWS